VQRTVAQPYEGLLSDIVKNNWQQHIVPLSDIGQVEPNITDVLSTENIRFLEQYLWDQVAIPMLSNVLAVSKILEVSGMRDVNGNVLFPTVLNLLEVAGQKNSSPCYPDIDLPYHPFWNSDTLVTNIYTEPDFYFYNSGMDGTDESPAIEADNSTAMEAYNRYMQAQIELTLQSFENFKPQTNNMYFTTPFNTPNMFEGLSAGINLEFGFNKDWAPSRTDDLTARTSTQTEFEVEGGETPGLIDDSETLVNSGISLYDYNKSASRNVSKAFSDSEDDTEENTDLSIADHLSTGMIGPVTAQNQNEEYLDWTRLRVGWGNNVRLSDSPPNLQSSLLSTNDIQTFRSARIQDVLLANQRRDSAFYYDFTTERFSGEDERFISGNTGYYDALNYSNNRLSLYTKVREATKGIGSKKLMMRRAIPTFKLYFIEEDNLDTQWVQYDDTYTYNQVVSVNIVESRKRPASLCEITFLNIGGALDGHNQWRAASDIIGSGADADTLAERLRIQESYNRETTSDQLIDTEREQSINRFILDQGTKIKVKLGYSNDAEKLDDMFLGEITEVEMLEEGNYIIVRAMSYGTELVAAMKGASISEIRKTYLNTFNLLGHMMFEPEVMHFGRKKLNTVSMIGEDQSLAQNEIIHKNTIGRTPVWTTLRLFGRIGVALGTVGISEAARFALGGRSAFQYVDTNLQDGSLIDTGVRGYIDRSMRQIRVEPLTGPQDDNIFAPNYSARQRMVWYKFTRWGRVATPQEEPSTQNVQTPRSNPMFDDFRPTGPFEYEYFNPEENKTEPVYEYFQRIKPYEISYNIFYSTIWEIFQEMTLRHPGFVAYPRIYSGSNRMTMFFGLPDQFYWAKEATLGDSSYTNSVFRSMEDAAIVNESGSAFIPASTYRKWTSLLAKRIRPFRSWHVASSVTDIIQNNMVANKAGFYTAASIQYVRGNGSRYLRRAARRLENAGQDQLLESGAISAASFVRFKDSAVEEVLAHADISPDNIRPYFWQMPNCKSKVMARRYGQALLAKSAKEMYKGTITLLGNPKIRPHDIVLLADSYNDVTGPIEVEEVIHMFTPTTGYITEIIPDTFIVNEDISSIVIVEAVKVNFLTRVEKYYENAVFGPNYKLPENNSFVYSAEQYRRQRESRDALIRSIALDAVGSPVSAAWDIARNFYNFAPGAVTLLTPGFLLYAIGSYFIINYLMNQRSYIMVPLMKHGKPWMAGYEINQTNAFYRSAFDIARRWWDNGGEGAALMWNDAISHNRRIREIHGSELTAFSRISLNLSELNARIRYNLATII
jgi:hypothetical protein